MFTWGWVFGGDFYDDKAQKVTADHPQNIKALEWMVDWTKRNGGYDEIETFRTGGSRQPDHAWELPRWLSQSPEATTWVGKEQGWYPAYRKAPFWEVVQQDPKRQIFYEILKDARHQRPVMPAGAEYGDLLGKALTSAVKGEQTPKVLLADVNREAQRILDERLRGA